jgi:branched-chain amino acid transport system ATP-binding protein
VSATVDAPAATSLRIENLHVARGAREVLEGVSLEITPGEVTALLGPNGAGKSSLVLAVGGALRASSGHVWLDGHDLSHRKPERIRAAGIAVVPEGRRLLRELTVEDNLRVATYTLPRDEAASGIDHAVELFPELRKRWDVIAGQLSGGAQQMVVLAQALVSRPKFLLVDELSLGLAPVVVKRLVPTLTEVADSGVGVLLIEQFAHVALGVSNSAYLIEGGKIRYHGTAAELREHPELLQSAYLLRDADEKVVDDVAEEDQTASQ